MTSCRPHPEIPESKNFLLRGVITGTYQSFHAINQILYYDKDPSERRNCPYVILFNNPIDQQQVMTLGWQMYPENPQHLMKQFREATSKPYGYLLIDL